MHSPAGTVGRVAMFLALAVGAAPAQAGLHAVGHEFRPTLEERAGTDPCTTPDGVTAALVFRCKESSPGSGCPNSFYGKLFAEWRTPAGEPDAAPVLVAEGYYAYRPPYSCSDDGAILLVLEPYARVVDRHGVRGTGTRICPDGSCFGPFGVTATSDGFLVVWPEYHVGLRGRRFDPNGLAASDPFVVAASAFDAIEPARNGLQLPDGDVLLAWRARGPGAAAVRVAELAGDGSIPPSIAVSEFPSIDSPGEIALRLEQPGRIVVSWENWSVQAGWVSRRVTVGDDIPTTTTTTSTTLDAAAPEFLPAKELGSPAVGDASLRGNGPGLVGDGTGNWFATWLDRVVSGAGDVLGWSASSSRDDARQWSTPEAFQSEDYPSSFASGLASDGGSVAIAAWARSDGAAVLFRRSTDGGRSWSETAPLYASGISPVDGDGYAEIGDLAVSAGSGGRWVVAWTESIERWLSCDEGDDDCIDYTSVPVLCGLRLSASTDGGQTWGEARTVEDGLCGRSLDLELASDGNGNWLVAWSGPDGAIHGVSSSDNAAQWSASRTLLSGIILAPETLTVAANRDGRWVMGFSQPLLDPSVPAPVSMYSRVYVSRSGDAAGDWTAPAAIAPWHDRIGGWDLDPSIAVDEDGGFGIAWSTHSADSGLDADIVAAFSNDAGETWTSPRTVDTEAGSDARKDLDPRLVRVGEAWAVAWRTWEPRTIRFAKTRGRCGNGLPDPAEECDDGNLVEGDGCDSSCLPTGCGSAVVTGAEECDDGNLDDTDDCVSCLLAFCGDGFVETSAEACDDANADQTDACLGDCTLARCGDSVVRPGLEVCDDGDASGNNDSCLNECMSAACGDGYLQLGKEECDDGNAVNGDGCTRRCRLEADCGFLNASGLRVSASDALKVLKRAVGIAAACPLRDCDTNHDGSVTAFDALRALRSAVGLFPEGCAWPSRLVLRLVTGEKLGALQVLVDYADAAGHLVAKSEGKPACEVLVPSALSAMNWMTGPGKLKLGIATLTVFQGPMDILRCTWDPVSGPSLHDFRVTVEDASGVLGDAIEPLPVVRLTVE